MPRKKASTKKTIEERINDAEGKLDVLISVLKREISERQIIDEEFARALEQHKRYLLFSEKDLEKDVNKLENVKSEILGYTLQSVTIVVGMLALILTIVFLWLNVNMLNEFYWFFLGIVVFFGAIFLSWFILWIKREP